MFDERFKFNDRLDLEFKRSASVGTDLQEELSAISGKHRLALLYAANNIKIDHDQRKSKSTFSTQQQ